MRFAKTILLVITLVYGVSAQKVLSGIVQDQKENPISNVKIQELGTYNIAYTNDDGTYSIEHFGGNESMAFSHPDYDSLVTGLKADVYAKVFLKLEVDANEYNLGFPVGYLDFKNKIRNKNLENMPYFLGESDINRQLQMLPGVEQGNEGYSNLFVRGGDADQNLVTYNGTPVYNFNHIFGISSIFHHRSIGNTGVYRGYAPASLGGRSSSYISLESPKTAEYSGLTGEFEMTPLNAGLFLQSIKKGRSYFTVAARRSWLDLLTPVESRQNSLNANIYDLQLNYGQILTNKSSLDFSLMTTRDLYFLAFTSDDTTGGQSSSRGGFTDKWRNIIGSAKYSHSIGRKLNAEQTLYYSDYKSTSSAFEENFSAVTSQVPRSEREIIRGIKDVGFKSDWNYLFSNKHTVSFGLQHSLKLFQTGVSKYSAVNYTAATDVFTTTGEEKYSPSNELAIYGADKFQLNENAFFNLGLRNVFYTYQGHNKFVIEPRVHFTTRLQNNDILKLGYSRHNQFLNQLNLGRVGNPRNIWVPSTELIAPQTVNFLEAGYERKLGSIYSASANIYIKQLNNLIQVANLDDAADPSIDWQGSVLQGTGRAFGGEIFLQKNKGNVTGWVSYAYSKSSRNFPDLFEEDFLFTFDRPHMLKVYANYTNKNSDWNFGINYIVGSGQLFTLPIGKFRDQEGNLQLEYNTLNNYRHKAYQRVDISVVRLKDRYGLEQEWRFYVYNILGMRNPLFVNAVFDNSSFSQLTVQRNGLTFVPGIAYIVKF